MKQAFGLRWEHGAADLCWQRWGKHRDPAESKSKGSVHPSTFWTVTICVHLWFSSAWAGGGANGRRPGGSQGFPSGPRGDAGSGGDDGVVGVSDCVTLSNTSCMASGDTP